MNKYLVLLWTLQSLFIYTIYAQNFCSNVNCPDSDFRSIDGKCNNKKVPWAGAAGVPYKRLLPPKYDNRNGDFKTKAKSGKPLPEPRDVSLNVHFPKEGNGPLSIYAVIYGQVIAHDISQGATQNGDCTNDINNRNSACINLRTLKRDKINQDQEIFEIFRTQATTRDFSCKSAAREQLNAATSWLDGSVIYGSTSSKARSVRAFDGGFLDAAPIDGLLTSRDFLPRAPAGGCNHEEAGRTCFLSGESRVNENLVLVSIQTLFVREHNRIAGILGQTIGGNDETLFQEAKRYFLATYQHIIYFEWLPLIVGKRVMDDFGLTVSNARNFDSRNFRKPYDENVVAQTTNEFMGAAFRWGHSMLTSNYVTKDRNYNKIRTRDLNEITFDPTEAYRDAGCDGFLRGAISEASSPFDPHIPNTPENHLFEDNGERVKRGSLSTLSIQRGRDHGFQSYVKYREFCGLSVPKNWNELDMPSENIENLRKTYESVDDIELYPGGLSETPVSDGVVGPVFACIIAKQFSDYKKGDRFFYESDLTVDELAEIKKATTARLICDNVGVASVPSNPFLAPSSSNPKVDCSKFASVDYSKLCLHFMFSYKFCFHKRVYTVEFVELDIT